MAERLTPEENLLRAIENPAGYWEERCAAAEDECSVLRKRIDALEAERAEVLSIARDHADQPTDYDEDTESEIALANRVLEALGEPLSRPHAGHERCYLCGGADCDLPAVQENDRG